MTTNLVIVAGQSNALGYQVTASELPSWYAPTAAVQIWTGSAWATMTPGTNTGTPANPGAWGPEVAFAAQWVQEHPGETLYLVKSVKGSTGLAADVAEQDWSPASTGELYDTATAAITAAKATLSGPFDTTVLWFQGEQDAASTTKAAAYATNLANFEAGVSTDWDADRFIYGRIDAQLIGNATVQGHQPDGFNTDEFAKQTDNLHLTGGAQIDSGSSFYAAYNTVALNVIGTASAERFVGSTGADSVQAGDGADEVYTGQGADFLHGNAGNDRLFAGAGDDTVYGGQGGDFVSLDDGNDWTQGNLGSDTLAGGWGNDTLYGGADSDRVDGGKGLDFVSGDNGDDTLTGGEGADTFYVAVANLGADVVTDFDGGAGDRLQLGTGTLYTLSEVAGDTVVSFVGGGSVTMDGVSLASFSSAWII